MQKANRDDMIAYLSAASDDGKWMPPSHGHYMSEETVRTILDNRDHHTVFRLRLHGGSTVTVYRIDGTTESLMVRDNMATFGPFGEHASWLRYWIVASEIRDETNVEVYGVSPDCYNCIMSTMPPEWKSDFIRLLKKYSV